MTGLHKALASLAVTGFLAGGCAGDRTARMPALEKLTLARVPGDPAAIRVTATGSVPSTGWSGAILQPVKDPMHPPGVVAFELRATPPEPGSIVELGEREMTAAAIATLPPGTRWVNVTAAVNDETRDVPGVRVRKVRSETRKYRDVYVRAGEE